MSALFSRSDEENVYVQELRKVFNSCSTFDGNIDRDGLQLFCQKLQLGENSSYIIGQLLPHKESQLNFAKFKEKFITLLPEIIEISDEDIEEEEDPRRKSGPFESTEDLLSAGEEYSPQSSSNPEYSASRPQQSIYRNQPRRITPLFIAEDSQDVYEGVGTGTIRSTVETSVNPALFQDKISDLGLAQDGYLNQYELKILSRHLSLTDASMQSLTNIFADLMAKCGPKVSLDEFFKAIKSFPGQLKAVEPIPTSSSTSSAQMIENRNYFTALDADNLGISTANAISQYWHEIGIPNGTDILRQLHFPTEGSIILRDLSQALEHEVVECSLGSDVLIAALLTYKAELAHLKEALDQSHAKIAHFSGEFERIQMRNELLVDELDSSRKEIEVETEQRMRNFERQCEKEVKIAEEKMKQERDIWLQQLAEMETTVNQLKSRESTLKSAISRLEKENGELCRELQATGVEPDDAAAPKAAKFRRNSDDIALAKQLQLWRERAEFYMQEHAELLDKFESLRADFDRMQAENFRLQNVPPKSYGSPRIQGSKTPNLGLVGRRNLKALLKKPPEKGRESSELESEPEPVIYMPRVKRRLNRRERDERFWALSPERSQLDMNIEPTTSEEELELKRQKGVNSALTGRSSDKKSTPQNQLLADMEHRHRLELANAEAEWLSERRRLESHYSKELQGFRERAEIEKREMQLRHRRELQDALQKQEKQLDEKFSQERKEIELQAASERNALEREFAEQKMEMMNRLQADFDAEIHRLSQASPTSKAPEALQKRIEELEGDLCALKNGYNHRLREQDAEYSQMISDLQRKHAEELDALHLQVTKLKDSHAVNFDQIRHPDQLPPHVQRLFYGLLDVYKAEVQANAQRDQQQMLEAFQRERTDALSLLELEHQQQVRQLREDHSKEIHQLEVELAGVQQSLESKHAGVVEAKNAENLARTEILLLKDRVAELESELTRLRLENEELQGANSTLKDAAEVESAKLSERIHQIESERAELIKKQHAAETYGGESGIEEDGMVEISKENDALKRENLALKAALVVSSSQLIRRIAPKFDAIDHFGEISSTSSGRPDDDLLFGGDEATTLFYESRLQSYQQLLNFQAEARAKQIELVDQAAALAKRAYLSDANQSAEVEKCRRELLALLRELAAPLQQQDPEKGGNGQRSKKTSSAQSSHA